MADLSACNLGETGSDKEETKIKIPIEKDEVKTFEN